MVLQRLKSRSSPVQSSPMHSRKRIWVPFPQEAEQAPNGPHGDKNEQGCKKQKTFAQWKTSTGFLIFQHLDFPVKSTQKNHLCWQIIDLFKIAEKLNLF